MMRLLFVTVLAVAGLVATSPAWTQQQPAIPMTVKGIIKTPPKVGMLLQVSGYLVTTDKEPKLQDTDNERKVILDFSQSTVSLSSLRPSESSPPPIVVTGRMLGTKDNGKPIIGVIGAAPLTR